jgi:hypothetical protein
MQVLRNFRIFFGSKRKTSRFVNSSAKYLQICRKAALALGSRQTQLHAQIAQMHADVYKQYQLLVMSYIPHF